jgi:hypothetical protein
VSRPLISPGIVDLHLTLIYRNTCPQIFRQRIYVQQVSRRRPA